jgi:hypothetical protein
MDGLNIQDFYDKDIDERLKELEREEEMLLLGRTIEEFDEEPDPILMEARDQIINKKALLKIQHKMKSKKNAFNRNFELVDVEEDLAEKGKNTEKLHQRFKDTKKAKPLSQLYAEADEDDEAEIYDEKEEEGKSHERNEKSVERRLRSMSRSRSVGSKRELTENEMVKNCW